MANYNEQDYQNALYIISQCKTYINKEVKPYINNDDFPSNYKLAHIETMDRFFDRGRAEVWITIGYRGMQVTRFCADGFEASVDISTNDKSGLHHYSYNNTPQKTIDFALLLACKWNDIKTRLSIFISGYQEEREFTSKTLANFTI